jgi:hypothetical protein
MIMPTVAATDDELVPEPSRTLPSGFQLNGVPQDTDPVDLQNLLV